MKATLFVVVNGRGTQILQIEVNYNFLKIDYDQFYSHWRQQQFFWMENYLNFLVNSIGPQMLRNGRQNQILKQKRASIFEFFK